jgi:hypothetical protein
MRPQNLEVARYKTIENQDLIPAPESSYEHPNRSRYTKAKLPAIPASAPRAAFIRSLCRLIGQRLCNIAPYVARFRFAEEQQDDSSPEALSHCMLLRWIYRGQPANLLPFYLHSNRLLKITYVHSHDAIAELASSNEGWSEVWERVEREGVCVCEGVLEFESW